MTKCEECGIETKDPNCQGFITGKDNATDKTKTICWACFHKSYKLKRPAKTNVFIKKGGK